MKATKQIVTVILLLSAATLASTAFAVLPPSSPANVNLVNTNNSVNGADDHTGVVSISNQFNVGNLNAQSTDVNGNIDGNGNANESIKTHDHHWHP